MGVESLGWSCVISPPRIFQQSDPLENSHQCHQCPVPCPSLTAALVPSQVCKDRRCQNASLFELEKCVSRCHGHGVSPAGTAGTGDEGRARSQTRRVPRGWALPPRAFVPLRPVCASAPGGAGPGPWLTPAQVRGRRWFVLQGPSAKLGSGSALSWRAFGAQSRCLVPPRAKQELEEELGQQKGREMVQEWEETPKVSAQFSKAERLQKFELCGGQGFVR